MAGFEVGARLRVRGGVRANYTVLERFATSYRLKDRAWDEVFDLDEWSAHRLLEEAPE